jgi:hypothetical protein
MPLSNNHIVLGADGASEIIDVGLADVTAVHELLNISADRV